MRTVTALLFGLCATACGPHCYVHPERAGTDLQKIGAALQNYATRHAGTYPSSLETLVTLDEHGRTYFGGRTTLPLDPWKNQYQYEPSPDARSYRIYSFGKDGHLGGSGHEADIELRSSPPH